MLTENIDLPKTIQKIYSGVFIDSMLRLFGHNITPRAAKMIDPRFVSYFCIGFSKN